MIRSFRTFRAFSIPALALALLAGGGCSALTGNDDDDRDRDGDIRRDSDRIGTRVDRDAKTASRVPRDARVVDEGKGAVSYTANGDGEVYLLDDTAGTVIWDAKVRDGDRVALNADDNRVTINGKKQTDFDIKSDHRFRLYFLRTR